MDSSKSMVTQRTLFKLSGSPKQKGENLGLGLGSRESVTIVNTLYNAYNYQRTISIKAFFFLKYRDTLQGGEGRSVEEGRSLELTDQPV